MLQVADAPLYKNCGMHDQVRDCDSVQVAALPVRTPNPPPPQPRIAHAHPQTYQPTQEATFMYRCAEDNSWYITSDEPEEAPRSFFGKKKPHEKVRVCH